MEFHKYAATGNDFVLVEPAEGEDPFSRELIRQICERHTGIGADGILVVLPSEIADVRMRIFNADGSEAEMCGNGARALALHVHNSSGGRSDEISIETLAGVRKAKVSREGPDAEVAIDMGSSSMKKGDIPMTGDPDEEALEVPIGLPGHADVTGTCVSMGNPHCVVFVENVEEYPLESAGPEIETNPIFINRTNVEFVQQVDPGRLLLRVWERGVGETLACGTGTCAAVVAAYRKGFTGPVVTVSTRGGELKVDCSSNEIVLTGEARLVFKGEMKIK